MLIGINDEAFGLLAKLAAESRVGAGHVIVHQGDLGTKLFIIVKGEVRVLRKSPHGDVEVARMKEGDFFGETFGGARASSPVSRGASRAAVSQPHP